ncbi:MAG: hypothetical protein QOF24_3190 [Verrucomicrobiota bacterium]
MKRTCRFFILLLLATVTSSSFAETKLGPDAIVENLYKAQKGNMGPFHQTKNRALVDRYFMKDLADMIWKDAVTAKGEVGVIDFDPMFGSQDPQISDFKINKSGWTADAKFGDEDKASVEVTFKNQGKKQTVVFVFDQDKTKSWKISDIRYPNDISLRNLLSAK